MSLFNCEKCGVIENTALSGYNYKGDGPALCSKCDSKIAKWHGCFPRKYEEVYKDDKRSTSLQKQSIIRRGLIKENG